MLMLSHISSQGLVKPARYCAPLLPTLLASLPMFPTSWAAYQALMTDCLLAVDKNLGVCPIGMGDT